MKKPTKGKRKRVPDNTPAPVLQVMPGGRVRLDPSIVNAVAVWMIATAKPWEREASKTLRSLEGADREAAKGRITYYRHAISAAGVMIGQLLDTLSIDEIDAAKRELAGSLEAAGVLGFDPATCQIASSPVT